MPPPNLDRSETLEKELDRTGVKKLVESRGKKPPRPNTPQLQPRSTDTRGRSQESISTPVTRPQRGFTPKSRNLAYDSLKEYRKTVQPNRAEQMRMSTSNPTTTVEAPPIMSRDQDNRTTHPPFATARHIPPPTLTRPDPRTAWDNKPGKTLTPKERKKILSQQFGSNEQKIKSDWNKNYNLGITPDVLEGLSLDAVRDELIKKQDERHQKWVTDERIKREKRNKPQLDFSGNSIMMWFSNTIL